MLIPSAIVLAGVIIAGAVLYAKAPSAPSSTSDVKSQKTSDVFPRGGVLLSRALATFQLALSDDLNTPKALAVVWNLIAEVNKNPKKYDAKAILGLLYDFDKVLGFGLAKVKPEIVSPEVEKLLKEREKARNMKNFKKADEIRGKIEQMDWQIKDTPSGPELIHA